MSALVECEGCHKPINERFQACPFCGAQRRARTEVRPTSLDRGHDPRAVSPRTLSRDARVALATAQITGQPIARPVTGPISALIEALRPSSATRGWVRILEIVLTVITLPFFLASIVGLFFAVKRWGRVGVIDWVCGALFGSFLLYLILGSTGIHGPPLGWTVAVMLGCWAARGVLRWFAAVGRLGDNA